MTRVVALLPGPPGDGSWNDAAIDALASLPADIECEVMVGLPAALPAADVVLAHGIQYEDVVRRGLSPAGPRVILSDRPVKLTGLEGALLVDWSWWEAAELAGHAAARVAAGGAVGLVAGPEVRTQLRLAEAFNAGVQRAANGASAHVVHLASFDAVDDGRAAGRRLAALGCRVLLTTADAAGDAAADEARASGVATLGFLHEHPDDLGYIRSDVTGVLTDLLRSAVAGTESSGLVEAGLASGRLALELR